MINAIEITRKRDGVSVALSRGERRGYWLYDVDFGQMEGSHNTYSYYQQVGASIVSTTVGTRSIQIKGYVLNDFQGTLDTRCKFLNTFFSPTEDYTLVYDGKKIDFRPDSSITWGRSHGDNSHMGRAFIVQGTAPFPLFAGAEDSLASFDSLSSMFRFPNNLGDSQAFTFGVTTETYSVDIDNTGGFDTGVRISISFRSTVTGPMVYNMTSGKFVGVDYTFHSGDVLEIDTSAGNKHITLTNEDGTVNLIRYRNVNMSWFQLKPGKNTLTLTCQDVSQIGGMGVSVYYTPLYQEVE